MLSTTINNLKKKAGRGAGEKTGLREGSHSQTRVKRVPGMSVQVRVLGFTQERKQEQGGEGQAGLFREKQTP